MMNMEYEQAKAYVWTSNLADRPIEMKDLANPKLKDEIVKSLRYRI